MVLIGRGRRDIPKAPALYRVPPISFDEIFKYGGRDYVALHRVPLAAGVFLSPSLNSIDQYVQLPPEPEFRHGIRYRHLKGVLVPVTRISAACVRGHSMIDRDICDGDIVF